MIITSKDQLIEDFKKGEKPQEKWRIGTEHEKFIFDLRSLKPVGYEGRNGIEKILKAFEKKYQWEPIIEDGYVIALKKGQASISLEPAGQFELSGAPLETLHETCMEVHDHLEQAREIATSLGVGLLGMGALPKWTREHMKWMPKARYDIMKNYMPKKGGLGIDMMTRTTTIQVNLDYSSEEDMIRKFKVGMILQPIVTSLFASSPFLDGKPTGYLSYRNYIWKDTDPDRTGYMPFIFEDGFGYERYVDYALDVPMYFLYREGEYKNVAGLSFRDFMKGDLPGFKGERPSLEDWHNHLTTIFPEVRLKHFLEMRGADGGPWRRICALPALWVGLLYDSQSLNEVEALCQDLTSDDIKILQEKSCKDGLHIKLSKMTARDLAQKTLALSAAGLKRRTKYNFRSETEERYLRSLIHIVESGSNLAEEMLEKYYGEYNQNIDLLYHDYAY